MCGVWVWMCGWVWEDADRGLGSSWARKGEQPLGPTKVGTWVHGCVAAWRRMLKSRLQPHVSQPHVPRVPPHISRQQPNVL